MTTNERAKARTALLRRFEISRSTSRGGKTDARGFSYVWRLRHDPEIERANPGWSRPFPSYVQAFQDALKATRSEES